MNLKRLTSLLLTLVMVLTLVPMAAFAEEAVGGTLGKRTVRIDNTEYDIDDFMLSGDLPDNFSGYSTTWFNDGMGKNMCEDYDNWICLETEEVSGAIEYYPAYVVKIENDQIVSMPATADMYIVGGDGSPTIDWVNVEKVNIGNNDNPIYAFRVSVTMPESHTLVPSMMISANLSMFIDGSFAESFTADLSDHPRNKSYNSNFDFDGDDEEEYTVSYGRTGERGYIGTELYLGEGTYTAKRYLVDLTGDEKEYAVEGISDFKVETTSDDIKITYIYKDDNENPCLGYIIEMDIDEIMSEELKVSFKAGEKEYFGYGPVVVKREAVGVEDTTATVSNVKEFLAAYRTMVKGTIYLEAGTYVFDTPFIHSNIGVSIVGKDADNMPVFKGNDAEKSPVITIQGNVFTDAPIKNIVVDGEGERVGIYCNNKAVSSGVDADNIVISNCTTGVKNTGDSLTRVTNGVFSNNTIAVDTGKGATSVYGSLFENNTTAVYINAATEYNAFANTVDIRNNSFVGNGTDILTANNEAFAHFQQNYFDFTDANNIRKPNMKAEENTSGDLSKVFYQPHYTTADRNVLDASLTGAQTTTANGTTTYLLPVELALNPNSVMKNNVFAEVKDNEAVEITVTSADRRDIVEWLYTKANLSTTMDFTATTTNIAASDKLEAGSATVEGNVGDAKVYQTINFAHSGDLPGAARVTVDGTVDATAEDAQLYLYHIDGDKLVLEEDAEVEVIVDTQANKNYYSFTSDHCSEYIISTMIVEDTTADVPSEEAPSSKEEDKSSSKKDDDDKATATATPAPTTAPVVVKPAATPAANDFISAIEVEEKINNAAEAEVVFDVSKKDIVSVKAFELLEANPEKALVFETEEFKWTFEGSDITDASAIEGTTFKPTISLESPNKDEIKAVAGEVAEEFTHIYFEHHGKLPGKAKVEVFVGTAEAGATKHLYHFDPTAKAFEFIETITLTADGWAQFGITHCSDYILSDTLLDESLVIKTEAETPTQPEEPVVDTPTEEPAQQKDGMGMMPIILIAVVVLAVVVVLIKKRKTE